MEPIASVSGWQQSYTDLSVPVGSSICYFVSFIPKTDLAPNNSRRAPSSDDGCIRSNVVSTGNAVNVVTASSARIIAASEELKLTDEQPTLQLYSIVLPAYTTLSRVAWSIVEGEELASINSRGLLTAYGGSGSLIVRATTLDGSNISAELTIPVEMTEMLMGDLNGDFKVDIADAVTVLDIMAAGGNNESADINKDGKVDIADFVSILDIMAGQ